MNHFKFIQRMSIAVLMDLLLKENGLKSDLIYRDDPYSTLKDSAAQLYSDEEHGHGRSTNTQTLPQFLNRMAFEMKNPNVNEQPELRSIVRDALLCMRKDELKRETKFDNMGHHLPFGSRFYHLVHQFDQKNMQLALQKCDAFLKSAAKFSEISKTQTVQKELSSDVSMNFIFAENLYRLGEYKAALQKVTLFFEMHSKTTKMGELKQIDFYFLRAKILLKMTPSAEDEAVVVIECRAAIDQAKKTCQ